MLAGEKMGHQPQFTIWKRVEYSLDTRTQLILASSDTAISRHLFLEYVIRRIGKDFVKYCELRTPQRNLMAIFPCHASKFILRSRAR